MGEKLSQLMKESESERNKKEEDPEDVREWTLEKIDEDPEAFEYLAER